MCLVGISMQILIQELTDTHSGTSSSANAMCGKLKAIFDLHKQNNNIIKDVIPFPEQDVICNDMAHALY